MWKQNRNLFIVAGVLALLYTLLQVGAGRSGDALELPADAAFVHFRERAADTGKAVTLLEGAAVVALLQERFVDLGPDLGPRARAMGELTAVTPPPPRPVRQRGRQDMGDEAGDAFSGLFPGSVTSRERTGWGWLADDVRQIQSSGGAGGIGEDDPPRRLFQPDDDGFRARRWLDE